MGAYYAYNTSNGYKVDTRSWYKIFEHMIMNNAFAKDMKTAIKDAGNQPNKIFGSVRNEKTTRRYMMENVLNLTYRSGRWSSFGRFAEEWIYMTYWKILIQVMKKSQLYLEVKKSQNL